MQMEAGLDTGPVRLEARTRIGGKTAGVLTEELSIAGARLMLDVLGDLDAYPARPQAEDGITYAPKIDKAETRLDRSEEHTSELQSLMRISYAVFCLNKKNQSLPDPDTKKKHTKDYLAGRTTTPDDHNVTTITQLIRTDTQTPEIQ